MSKSKKLEKYESQTSSWFCAVTHDLSLADKIKISIKDFPDWAWIYHDSDTDEGTPHVHFMFRTNGTRTIKQVSDKIELPSNFIQVCRSLVGFRRYMLHLDSAEKIQYTVDDVHTNKHRLFREAKDGELEVDSSSIYYDFCRLKNGNISPHEFLIKNMSEIDKLSFYQKIKIYDLITSFNPGGRAMVT